MGGNYLRADKIISMPIPMSKISISLIYDDVDTLEYRRLPVYTPHITGRALIDRYRSTRVFVSPDIHWARAIRNPVTRKKTDSVALILSLCHPASMVYMIVGGPPALKAPPMIPVANPAMYGL